MSKVTIYHNPRCTKSRETLALLLQAGIEPEIVEYLKDTPSKAELEQVLSLLGMEPAALVRSKEKVYAELGLADRNLSRDEWLEILIANPVLIERPIVTKDNKACIGRPPENVHAIL